MWPNNGFGNNGQFQNNFNQDDFPSSPFGTGSGPSGPGQQYFQLPHHQNAMRYEDSNDEGFNGFQPEVGLFNEGAFIQNQHNLLSNPNPNLNPQFSPLPFNKPQAITPTPPRPTKINERAAELKAQLLLAREGRASPVPPAGIPGLSAKQTLVAEGPSSTLRGSPITPVVIAENREQELNINALISEYSESKPAANASTKQESNNKKDANNSALQRIPTGPITSAKSLEISLGSPTKVLKPASNGLLGGDNIATTLGSRHTSNGSPSEMSEGEIPEEPTPIKAMPPTEPRQAHAMPAKTEAHPTRKPREEQAPTTSYNRGLRDESPTRRAPPKIPKAQPTRGRDDRREDSDRDRRSYEPDYRHERKRYSEPDNNAYHPRRDTREEENRRPEAKIDPRREETIKPPKEQRLPTLEQLLPIDEDLREWLEITGFHNIPYRDKILNRRRAIAALDAQRDRLLAEMEAEERGGVPIASGPHTPNPTMLPPPIPNKAGGRTEPAMLSGNTVQDPQRDRVVSNKRPYSDVQDTRTDGNSGKLARTDDRINHSRIKEEEDMEYRRPRSSGLESSRRDDGETSRGRLDENRSRGDARGRSRERDSSPGRRAYENRPPARTRSYEEDFRDGDEFERGPRPYEVRGGYRGRAFDPKYRGRGRGRGRGDFQSHAEKNELSFGSRIANGKPYRDPKGFERGGKGDTKYFIVKSFNEENVLKCIADSIWTTQVQNGTIFKEAFEKCKNVILIFSINKSRAFQGYARMESLPGSIKIPDWQRAINWESAGAFKVRWLVICSTRFHRIGHLKNSLNENQAVLIGKDGQEIEEHCGAALIELIDEEVSVALDDRLSHWEENEY